jgi:hypothetical protein
MNLRRKLAPLTALLCLAALTSCGVSNVSPANLNGNWNLTGNAVSGPYPALSAAMMVVGNQVSANALGTVQCPPNAAFSTVGGVLTGPIAADGSFTMTGRTSLLGSSTQITVTGKVPPEGGTTWSGAYSIAYDGFGCVAPQNGELTATQFIPLNGAYAGNVANTGLGPEVKFSAQLVQANSPTAMAAAVKQPTVIPVFLLSGEIAISGSPCFTQGTVSGSSVDSVSSADPYGILIGSFFSISYLMNDGSTLQINGNLADTTAVQLVGPEPAAGTPVGASFGVSGGKCDGADGNVILVRQ